MPPFSPLSSSPPPPPVSALGTHASLLERLPGPVRDQAAWSLFSTVYRPMLLRWLYRWNLPESEREDVIQMVMIAVCESIGKFTPDGKPRSFRRWLWGILRNQANAKLRKISRFQSILGRFQQRMPPELRERDTTLTRLMDGVHKQVVLPLALDSVFGKGHSRNRNVLERFIRGETGDEVAEACGITPANAYQIYHRGLRDLRVFLTKLLDS